MHLAEKLDAITREDACVIANTFRPHSSTRLLELLENERITVIPATLMRCWRREDFARPGPWLRLGVDDVWVYEKTAQK